jgi:hypothetical protein
VGQQVNRPQHRAWWINGWLIAELKGEVKLLLGQDAESRYLSYNKHVRQEGKDGAHEVGCPSDWREDG